MRSRCVVPWNNVPPLDKFLADLLEDMDTAQEYALLALEAGCQNGCPPDCWDAFQTLSKYVRQWRSGLELVRDAAGKRPRKTVMAQSPIKPIGDHHVQAEA